LTGGSRRTTPAAALTKVRWKRFAGVALTASLVALAATVFRPTNRPSPFGAPPAPVRGGQLVASIRSELRSYNRLVSRDPTADLLSFLTQGHLVRINRASFELEPWLAESWDASADGRSYTLHLRKGVTWSDGTPFTAADVLFSFRALYDARAGSVIGDAMLIDGQPIAVSAPDATTVVLRFPAVSGPGLRLLDNLPILPRHKLEASLNDGSFASAWGPTTTPSDIVGTGPFVVREYQPGQRVVLDRNPRYWRKSASGATLPFLDRLVLEIVPDQDAELVRLQSGQIDLTQSELRADDYLTAQRSDSNGTLKMIEMGVGTDADAFWFCMKPEVKRADPRFAFVQRKEFRQALSYAVNRETFADQVFLSAAVPVWGPITPGNRVWFYPDLTRYPPSTDKAKALLKEIGLEDRNGNGVVEDERGTEARFTVITQRGIGAYERGTTFLRNAFAQVGVAIDVAPLENGALIQRLLACNYDAIYYRPLASDLDPAGNMDFWLSSGSAHVWNINETAPATEWERQIDILMRQQATTTDLTQRRQQFAAVQKVFAENLPVLYFAAPRLFYVHSPRVAGVVPSVLRPPALWNADSIGVTGE
jgi:peptide/nickel transport system substrate-binding protein